MLSETVELRGHIIDSQVLQRVLDQVMTLGGDYKIEKIDIGHSRGDKSFARVRIDAPTPAALHTILELITRNGATLAHGRDARLEKAPAHGVLPDDFYATTNLPTDVSLAGKWIPCANAEMDCAIVITKDTRGRTRARCLRMHRVKKGDRVVVGHEGIRVAPIEGLKKERGFEFMASAVSSEKPKHLVIREIARLMRDARRSRRRILFVGGPAIVHTGAGPHLERLIHAGYIDVLFAGNALAAHDIESQFFNTSLGVSLKSGSAVEHGHEHHLRSINRVRACGSIAGAVRKGILKTGIMHACVKRKVPFVLSGSIRDDGPLPDVLTDMPTAQDAMRAQLFDVSLALMVGTTLLSIATGNMLPATAKTICVDINPAVVTKLSDRGTFQAIGLVTDAELFLRQLTAALKI